MWLIFRFGSLTDLLYMCSARLFVKKIKTVKMFVRILEIKLN